jgi:hypothetical protein
MTLRTEEEPMSALRRMCFAHNLTTCLAAAGLTGTIACTATDTQPPEESNTGTPSGKSDYASAEQRIAEGLQRLDALEVIEVGDLFATRTVHEPIPYTDQWRDVQVEMTADEQADRLAALADAAEQAVSGVDASGISEDFFNPDGSPALCYALDDKFCLTRDMNAENLARANGLEIVGIADILRSQPQMGGHCYSSWDTVREEDCVRALKLEAIVAATAEFPNAWNPDGEDEQ